MRLRQRYLRTISCLLLIVISACSLNTTSPDSALWGTWRLDAQGAGDNAFAHSLTFYEDGRLVLDGQENEPGEFVVIAPGRIKLSHLDSISILNYEISEEILRLTVNDIDYEYSQWSESTAFVQAETFTENAPSDLTETPTLITEIPSLSPTSTITPMDSEVIVATEPLEEATPIVYSQAPILNDLNLPPLRERLPDQPVVIEPLESIGQYGGTWHTVTNGPELNNIKMKLYDPPIRWRPDYSGYEMGLAESFEFNENGTQLTLYLRKGVKWSDGVPYTTADWAFWWNDLALNNDYDAVSVPWWARNEDGSPFTIEFPDKFTIVMTWDTPHWIAPYVFAQGYWEWEPLMKPAHFLKQYHPKYSSNSFSSLEDIDKWWQTPGYPTIFAWVVQRVTPNHQTLFVRNPYYWKVDPEGHQLPYIDYLLVDIQPDKDTRLSNMAMGKYDASFRGSEDPRDIPYLVSHANSGNYSLQDGWMNGAGAWPGWIINQDYAGDECGDPLGSVPAMECRELLSDSNFLKGLSHALDRKQILDSVWDGNGYITQATISPQSWHFTGFEGQFIYETWRQSYIEHNPQLAENYLNAAGFTDTDGDGWRNLPSGAGFILVLDLNEWGGSFIRKESDQIAKENWESVGIKVFINDVQGKADDGIRANQGLFMVRGSHISELDIWTYPDWVFPVRGGGEGSRAFPLQGLWFATGGTKGIQPTQNSPGYRLQQLYNAGISEPDENKRHEILWEAIRIHINEGPFAIGATGDQPMPVIIKENFHNVPMKGVLGPWAPGSPGNTHPEQYWIEQ